MFWMVSETFHFPEKPGTCHVTLFNAQSASVFSSFSSDILELLLRPSNHQSSITKFEPKKEINVFIQQNLKSMRKPSPTSRFGRTVKQGYLSTASHYSRIRYRVRLYLQRTASTSWSPIHPLNLFHTTCALWTNSATVVEHSLPACQIYIFCWMYATFSLVRPSLYLQEPFLIKPRSLFSSKASSPSMIR